MKWKKKGLIFSPDGSQSWARHSALQPTPILISEQVIRVFLGFRDEAGVSSVGFVDVSTEDPGHVLRVSDRPALVSGEPGAFDENGVVPCAITRTDQELLLCYAGYQLGQKVRFHVFGGLAASTDGETFTRVRRVPILDRQEEALLFRVAHTIRFEDGRWRVWYGAGSEFRSGKNKSLPVYDIRYLETQDLLDMPKEGKVCVAMHAEEHRVGRPYVVRRDTDQRYLMFYGAGTEELGYRLGYAESMDGISWERRDADVGIEASAHGWDSTMQAYPAVVSVRGRTYLFYNGNDYGRTGFGYAELDHW